MGQTGHIRLISQVSGKLFFSRNVMTVVLGKLMWQCRNLTPQFEQKNKVKTKQFILKEQIHMSMFCSDSCFVKRI